jgi:murein DD-endopeptidase MepM/ murein hydrolase activator NlpD
MEKKFSFSDQPMKVKIIYGAVIAVLCISAIIVGIVSVASRKEDTPPAEDVKPPVTDVTPPPSSDTSEDNKKPEPEKPKATSFVAPLVGVVAKGHSLEMPVFSATLNEWRVHTGIDIAAEIGAAVKAVAGGTVTAVRSDHFMGKTVEVTHDGGIVSVYSNLSNDGIAVKVGDTVSAGDTLGVVGDTSLTELADESHLHFEILVSGVSVNPLDYISDESKKNDFGLE